MKKIYIAPNPVIAHMVRGLLESHGIASRVKGEQLFSVRGELPMVGDTFPTVWLEDESDLQQARQIVDDFDRKMKESPKTNETWRCERCGEEHEMQFSSCWKCGRARKLSQL